MSSTNDHLTYVIVDKQILPSIFQPLKTNRVKYTCFEVSHNFLILGATSGGLYIFRRDPCIFLQLVPNKEGSINNIALSPDEKLIAFSSLKGISCVLELHNSGETRLVNRSVEHNGSNVTSLVWAKTTNQLYVGDNLGRLSLINVSLFMNKNIFQVPAYMFMKLDSAVVQISCYEVYLLVSTKTRCYICDTTKEKYKQIGNQLREGVYGATFFNSSHGLKIYCARPGSRLWEADICGNVISTHQFKKALAIQSVAVVKLEENEMVLNFQPFWPDQSFNFCILVGLLDKYLFTFKNDGIYLFDPLTAEVVLWSDHYQNIVDAKCVRDIVYLWTSSGEIHSFVVTPLSKCLVELYCMGKYQLCVDVLEIFQDHATSFNIMSKLSCLVGLQEHIPDINENSSVCAYLQKLISYVKERKLPSNLDSGIFLVDNRHWKKWKCNIKNGKTTRKKIISRSQSLSDLKQLSLKASTSLTQKECSLPEIQFLIDDCNAQVLINQNVNYDAGIAWTAALSSSFMQQIPFLSLTSPDIIHSTIVELGQNVKKKLSMSTKSLQNKWHIFEGRIKFLKGINGSEPLDNCIKDDSLNEKGEGNENKLNDSPEDIVYKLNAQGNHKDPQIDVADICEVCDIIQETEHPEDFIYQLFDKLVEKLNTLNQFVSPDDIIKKSFPFKQAVPAKYVAMIQDIFHESFRSRCIVKYIDRTKMFQLNYLEFHEHPIILREIHSADDLLNDVVFSNILLLFAEILDPHLILLYLENSTLPCTFFSWSIVLDVFQDSSFNFFATKSDSVDYLECPLPFLLNMLFLMLRLDQVESSCHVAVKGNLNLHYVSYLVLKLSMHLQFTGIKYQNCIDRCNKLLLSFLLKLSDNDLLFQKGLRDPETLYHIESAFLSINKFSGPICNCNYPLVGNNKPIVKYSEIGMALLKLYLSPFKVNNSASCNNNTFRKKEQVNLNNKDTEKTRQKLVESNGVKFCMEFLYPNSRDFESLPPAVQNGYLKVTILLQIMPDILSELIAPVSTNIMLTLPFIVQFGKIHDLDEIIHRGSFEFWKRIFDLNSKLSYGECCICSEKLVQNVKVDWNKLSILTLKSLGSADTIKLMMSYVDAIQPDEIDTSFFRACFLSDTIKKENENISFLIDVYCNQFQFERSNSPQDSALDDFTEIFEQDKVPTSNYTIVLDLKTELCCQCSLTLRSDKINLDGRIRAFRCKHIYHLVCLTFTKSLFECPLCKKNNLSSGI